MKFKVTLLFTVLTFQLHAQTVIGQFSKKSLPKGVAAYWDFKVLTSFGNKRITLANVGDRVDFDDAGSAIFNGKGWLASSDRKSGSVLSPEHFTIGMRLKAEKSGGLIKMDLCSIVIHPSGLVIARLPVTDRVGTQYREFPLAFLEFDQWYEIILRFDHGKLNFVRKLSGQFEESDQFEDYFKERLKTIEQDALMIGTFSMEEPPGAGLPQPAKNWLYERPFAGIIDVLAIWNRYLTDNEVASLCGVKEIGKLKAPTSQQKALQAYSHFYDASRAKDAIQTQKLGLEMRRFMSADPKRPTYHLTAPLDGLFDPAGAFYHKGQYHVFSYRNMIGILANSPLSHYVSDDLIHWKDMPIAVWADHELDEKGIWLGNLFYDDTKTPTMIYTGLGKKGKFGIMAKSQDETLSFSDKKAVITSLAHHDGHTWKDGDTWYSITVKQYWGKLNGKSGDGILLFSSKDLIKWMEEGEIFNVPAHPKPADDNQKNGLAEFPYLLPMGDKHVLMIGIRPVRYWIGKYDKSIPAFIPDEPQGRLLDFLNNFHCFNPSAIDFKGINETERRIIMAMNVNISGQSENISWYGTHVLPRTLTRNGDRLMQEPVPESNVLRGKHYQENEMPIKEGNMHLVKNIQGDVLEMIAEFEPANAKRFGIILRSASGGKKDTRITYDIEKDEIRIDGGVKITSPYTEIGHAKAYIKPGEPVKIHLFLDRALLEVFVNGQAGNTVFDGKTSDMQYYLFSEGGDAILKSLNAWDMKPAWE